MAEIDIPGVGKIQIDDKSAWATEETLNKLVKALGQKGTVGDFAKSIGRTGDKNPKTFIGGLTGASVSAQKLSKSADVAAKAFTSIQSVASGAAGIVGTLAQSKGSFSDLNPIIDSVAGAMGDLAGSIPIVGGFFKALIGFSAEIAKLNNVILDDLLTNFMALGKQGLNLTTDLQSIQLAALDAGVSFQTLTGAVLNNFEGMIAFGGSVDKATKRFGNALNFLADPNNPQGFAYAMQSLGYGSEEAAEFLGQFIEQNKNSLRLQNMTDREVATVAFEYAKNLQVLSELTGVQVDEIRANQMAQLTDGAFQAKLQQMRNADMEAEAKAMQDFAGTMRGMSPIVEKGFKDVTAGLMTEQTALLLRTVPGLESAFLARDEEAVRNLLAGLAKDGAALEIGTLGLLDATNPLTQLINDLLPASQRLLGIVEGGPTQEELETQQQQQMDQMQALTDRFRTLDIQGLTFEHQLVAAGKKLDVMGGKVQSQIVETLIPAMEAQLSLTDDALTKLTNFLDNPTGFFKTRKDGPRLFEFDPNPGDPDNKNFSLFPKYGGGNVGGGMYMVGERGPELLRLNQGSMGHVYNHGQTNSMLNQGIIGRFGGGGVNGGETNSMLTTVQLGSHGSKRVDAEGKVQEIHMGLDADTTLSFFKKSQTLEIVRALMTEGLGSYGVSGSAQSGSFDKEFYQAPDGSRIYGAEGQAAMMKAVKDHYGVGNMSDQAIKELIDMQKEMNELARQNNMIQSSMLKETKRKTNFNY